MTAALHYSNLMEFVTERSPSAPPLMPDGVNNAAWSLLCSLVCVCACVFSVSRHCELVSTAHMDTLTEWASTDISLVISHPQSYFSWSKLTGLSRWIIPGDWLSPKQQINEFMAFSRYLDLGTFNAKKRIKRVEIRIN